MTNLFSSDLLWWGLFLVAALIMMGRRTARPVWTAVLGLIVFGFLAFSGAGPGSRLTMVVVFGLPALVFNLAPLRRMLVSDRLLAFYRRSMPEISRTEREALEAGTTWWDAELFSGRPDWREFLDSPPARMSEEEQAFLDGPVETLCAMLDDYRIDNEDHDLPAEAWQFIRENGFFGMIIPREFGGKGFSAYGHAAVVMKIATRSISAALTVMIPNSVGPGKLLLKYGTEEQRNHYLPRLARAEEIPCFALTAPEAGSDAGAIPDTGVVCRGDYKGRKDVLGIRLNFNKRYITLGPVATVLGLAFKLYDPEHLLGEREDLGITLALVPADTPGVETGRRHNPMHMAFMNGPVRGTDVFVPMDQVIGGVEQVGNGWRMLMESLTDGRAISLPALSTASAKVAARITGAYAVVRRQFNVSIAQFEGIQEALARIAGYTYSMDAARLVTLAALDAGHKPSVISAIVKYNLTYRARQVVNDAIEVHGGAAICLGPANPLGQLHSFPSVGVTVEGHNILTRNLITFGQGAIRCHPYLLAELQAAQDADGDDSRRAFDRALLGHIGHAVSNGLRAVWLGLTGARLASVPADTGRLADCYRQINRMSAAFSVVTDLMLLTYRGSLKRRERLSARMADVVSQLYLASVTLKHFHNRGRPAGEEVLVRWVVEDCLHCMQESFHHLAANMESRLLAWVVKRLAFPLGRSYRAPSDDRDAAAAASLLRPSAVRDGLTAGMYLPESEEERLTVLESAFEAVLDTAELETKVRRAIKAGKAAGRTLEERIRSAAAAGVLTEAEAERLRGAEAARSRAIQVDDFAALGETAQVSSRAVGI